MENVLRAGLMQHGRCLSVLFVKFFPLKLELRAEEGSAGVRGESKQGLLLSWVLISKAWHGHNGPGNDLEGACGLLPSDYFQGRFRYDNSEGKGVDPLPPHSSVVLTSIVRAQHGSGAPSMPLPHSVTWDIASASALLSATP